MAGLILTKCVLDRPLEHLVRNSVTIAVPMKSISFDALLVVVSNSLLWDDVRMGWLVHCHEYNTNQKSVLLHVEIVREKSRCPEGHSRSSIQAINHLGLGY